MRANSKSCDALSAGRGRAILNCCPGVAELADALDSKTNACRFFKRAHPCSCRYRVYLSLRTKKPGPCSRLLILSHGEVIGKLMYSGTYLLRLIDALQLKVVCCGVKR